MFLALNTWQLHTFGDISNMLGSGHLLQGGGGGGAGRQNGRGASEVLPLQKEGAQQVLAMLKGGGGTKSFEVLLTQEL